MKSSYLILILSFLFSLQAIHAAGPSPEIQRILKERLVGKNDLNLKDLTASKSNSGQLKKFEDPSAYETYKVPYPKKVFDYFAYSIYRSKATGEIWILKTGGFAGVSELYVVPTVVRARDK